MSILRSSPTRPAIEWFLAGLRVATTTGCSAYPPKENLSSSPALPSGALKMGAWPNAGSREVPSNSLTACGATSLESWALDVKDAEL